MTIEEQKLWKWMQSIAIIAFIWSFLTLFADLNQAVYIITVIITLLHGISIWVPWTLYRKGVKYYQYGNIRAPMIRIANEFSLFFVICEWFFTWGPLYNVHAPNIIPFIYGLEFIYYALVSYVYICSLEVGIYVLIKFKTEKIKFETKKSTEIEKKEPISQNISEMK